MDLSFWKICDLSLLACKSNDFKYSIKLCSEARLLNDDKQNDSHIIAGRERYITNLLQYIEISEQRYLARDDNSSTTNMGGAAAEVNKFEVENRELKEALFNAPSVDPLCIVDPGYRMNDQSKSDFGIIVFGHTRTHNLRNVLESLKLQDALQYTEVWLDGDQGKDALRQKIVAAVELVKQYPVKRIHTQRGNYGFRKMILLGMAEMVKNYKDIMILEDDCFPTKDAVTEFRRELDSIRNKPEIFSVYGHHFGMEDVNSTFGRFQGWGWATTSEKLLPVLRQLIDCYSMSEAEYLKFVSRCFSEDIRKKIDITPPRLSSHCLTKFFAWDETTCLLTSLNGQSHKPTKKRTIYNCGMGDDSTNFPDKELFRKPPFNMITPSEVWDYFD
jgi:hypothetical protein